MEEDLVSQGSDSEKRKGAGTDYSTSLCSFLYDSLALFLSIGMTSQEFWEEDGDLAICYRKAEEYRQDRANWFAHLQGLYIYEAICDVAPILNPLAKKGTKARPYPSRPYGADQDIKIDKKAQTEKARDVFFAWAIRFNERRSPENG